MRLHVTAIFRQISSPGNPEIGRTYMQLFFDFGQLVRWQDIGYCIIQNRYSLYILDSA